MLRCSGVLQDHSVHRELRRRKRMMVMTWLSPPPPPTPLSAPPNHLARRPRRTKEYGPSGFRNSLKLKFNLKIGDSFHFQIGNLCQQDG